jgi:hypothetical protein
MNQRHAGGIRGDFPRRKALATNPKSEIACSVPCRRSPNLVEWPADRRMKKAPASLPLPARPIGLERQQAKIQQAKIKARNVQTAAARRADRLPRQAVRAIEATAIIHTLLTTRSRCLSDRAVFSYYQENREGDSHEEVRTGIYFPCRTLSAGFG